MATDAFLNYRSTGIAGLLRAQALAVPEYQRAYSWTCDPDRATLDDIPTEKLQVDEYWQDISTSFRENESYFLGTVVLSNDGLTGRQSIIDGQQRLATTSIVLAAIRDYYDEQGENQQRDSIHTEFLAKFDRRAKEERPQLILSNDDHYFYNEMVIKKNTIKPMSRSQQLIADAYAFLFERVTTFVREQGAAGPERLTDFIQWLSENALLVVIEVATVADAFIIFETLNDRGADLTVADLLKNYVFKESKQRLGEVQKLWTITLANLDIDKVGNQLFTDFARHLLSSKHGRTREREVYARLRRNVKGSAKTVSFCKELVEASRLYYALLSPDSEVWASYSQTSARAGEVLAQFGLEQYRPLMLAALQTFSEAEIEVFLPTMVSWVIRALSKGTLGAGTAESAFCEAATKIRDGQIKSTRAILDKTRVGFLVPEDIAFEEAFKEWKVPKGSLARYILRALEEAKINKREPELIVNPDPEQVNLEHIYPRSARERDWRAFKDVDSRAWLHRLGNLCLLHKGPNGRIGNKPWTTKRPILQKSEIELTREVARFSTWTTATIAERQRDLAALAVMTWPRMPRTRRR